MFGSVQLSARYLTDIPGTAHIVRKVLCIYAPGSNLLSYPSPWGRVEENPGNEIVREAVETWLRILKKYQRTGEDHTIIIIIIITIITYHNNQNSHLPHDVEVVVHFILGSLVNVFGYGNV